jgi:hypothetical protein
MSLLSSKSLSLVSPLSSSSSSWPSAIEIVFPPALDCGPRAPSAIELVDGLFCAPVPEVPRPEELRASKEASVAGSRHQGQQLGQETRQIGGVLKRAMATL